MSSSDSPVIWVARDKKGRPQVYASEPQLRGSFFLPGSDQEGYNWLDLPDDVVPSLKPGEKKAFRLVPVEPER